MRLACVQFRPEFGNPEGNLAALRALCRGRRADLAVLPELCTTGYAFADRGELEKLAERATDGPSSGVFQEIARGIGGLVCAGIAEREGTRIYNSAVLVGPSGVVGVYRKVHLFDRENDLFDRGDLGFRVFTEGGVAIGVMICFDWFYPESMRTLTLLGAEVVAHPANLVMPWCQRSMPVRCLENHVIAATCNRTGEEDRAGVRYRFTGASQITGFTGEVLAAAPCDGDAWIDAVVEPGRARDRRLGTMRDFLALRRPDAYLEPAS